MHKRFCCNLSTTLVSRIAVDPSISVKFGTCITFRVNPLVEYTPPKGLMLLQAARVQLIDEHVFNNQNNIITYL